MMSICKQELVLQYYEGPENEPVPKCWTGGLRRINAGPRQPAGWTSSGVFGNFYLGPELGLEKGRQMD